MTDNKKLLIGVVSGATLGLAAHALLPGHPALSWTVDNLLWPTGQIFLRLLFVLVAPLLFSALVLGVCELELKQLGRLGVRTLAMTVVVSTIAVLVGLVLVNALQPGKALSLDALEAIRAQSPAAEVPKPPSSTAAQLIVSMVPDNIIRVVAQGDMIGLIFFSLLFGIALAGLQSDSARTLKAAIAGLYEVMMRLIHLVLRLAPLGVGALLFVMGARLGPKLIVQLGVFVGVVLLGLSLHMFGVYSLAIRFIGKRSPLQFFKSVRLAMVTAFSTASSSATLPTALQVGEEELKLPRHVSRFVLTAGAAMNQNGTALFEGVTVLFLAQLYDVPLTLLQQGVVMLICILGGIGTAGVPAGSIPVIAMILVMFGIPVEGLGLILGVDRFLDMCRTTVNVTGDLAIAVCVANGEQEEISA